MPYSFFTDSVQSIPLYLPSLHAAPPFSPEPAFNPPLYLPSLHAALSLNFISGVHFPLPCPLPLSFLHAGSFLFSTNQRSIYLSICHLCTPLFPLTPFPAFIFLCLVLCLSLFCTPAPTFSPRTSGQSTSLPSIPARRSFPLTPFPAFIFLCLVLCLSLFCTPALPFLPNQRSIYLSTYHPCTPRRNPSRNKKARTSDELFGRFIYIECRASSKRNVSPETIHHSLQST